MKSLSIILFVFAFMGAYGQQYFTFGPSATYGRSEWFFQMSPTNTDNNRLPVGWIKGQQSSPGVALYSTFAMATDTIRFVKFGGSGDAVAGLTANGSVYRLDKYSLIDSTFLATRSWVNSILPNISGKLNISDTSTMLTGYVRDSELTWSNLQNKPATFMPMSHMHGVTEVISLQDSISSRVPNARQFTINGITQDLSADRTFSNVGIELPSQAGQSGKVLSTNGTSASWTSPSTNSFTVTPFSAGSRTFGTAYQYTSTGEVSISVSISCNLSLSGGQAGNIQLQVSPNGTTGWVTYATLIASNTGTLTVGLNTTQVSGGQLTASIQAGEYWRVISTSTVGSPYIYSWRRI